MGFKLQTGPMTAEATVKVNHPVDGEVPKSGKHLPGGQMAAALN